ncbi:MAG TPA: hypothetical protein VGQ33_00495 [Vicinamibacteria bacterium]|nr:hypothetical protein [Vicinamibacteria bacterium]
MTESQRPLRKPYEPPVVRKVRLVPGEVAVAGCKSVRVATDLCRRGTQLFVKALAS